MATLASYRAHAQDAAGNVLASASVEVRLESNGALAALYSDRGGTASLGNPFNADANGFFAFHVVGGAYKITVTSGALTQIFRYVGIGTYSEYDSTADVSIAAGGTPGKGLLVSSQPNFGVFFGSGAPTLAAAKGSLYLRSDGTTTNNRTYVNTDGGTTWTAVTTAA